MDSGAASEIAIHAYATVFALLEKFIGERLVERVLHSAFLETDGTLPKEKE